MSSNFKQLNPFELKSAITTLLNKIESVKDVQNCLSDIDMLDAQEDKTLLSKLLFKELPVSSVQKIPVICFLLEHFIPKEELIKSYWEVLKSKSLQGEVRIAVLNILRELDSDWSYEACDEYLDDAQDILDENTRHLLNNAIINPETQIDFMDFLHSIKVEDQLTLINSFGQDFDDDALANILIPVFESNPESVVGKEALKLLGKTKSQLALRVLTQMQSKTKGELNQLVRKSLAELKMSGIREDNTQEFYAKILSDTKPDKFYLTYPDGRGDMALIFTRITDKNEVRFVSIVVNVDSGIKDCFGFYKISLFERDKILEKFLKNEKVVSIVPDKFKTILYNAELITINRSSDSWELPYEYVCWKNLLIDIDYEEENIEQILKTQLLPAKVDNFIFDKLQKLKVSAHWFLDANYSDEFEEMTKELKDTDDLDNLIDKYLKIVFYDEEKMSWIKKLRLSAYIKHALNKNDEAIEIYGLTTNEVLFDEFLKEILQRSVYEYLISVKYNKDLNTYNFTQNEILSKIKYIESKWVSNV